MKSIKSLIVAGLGALILCVAAVPAGAQTWNRSRNVVPQQRREFRIEQRDHRFDRRRFELRSNRIPEWRLNERIRNDRFRLERLRGERRFDNRFRQHSRIRIIL